MDLLDSMPKPLAINKSIQNYSQKLLSILLVKVSIGSFDFPGPAEQGFGWKALFIVTQIFFEKYVDFSNSSKVFGGVYLKMVINSMQLFTGIKTLEDRVEEAGIS